METKGQAPRITIEEDPPHLVPAELKKDADLIVRELIPTFAGIDAAELEQYVDADVDWLVDYVFSADQPTVFGAASKATKTTQLVDLSVALATGSKWLDFFNVSKQRKVLFITGESNYRAISKRIARALKKRDQKWRDVSGWLRVEAVEFPTLPNATDKIGIASDIEEHGIDVVIIDPLYRGLGTLDTHRMAEMGDAIVSFTKACQPASVIIAHHIIKSAAREPGPPTLESLSGAGLAESCGNWWLIGRNKPYDFDRIHDLSVTYGGRDEQAGFRRIVFNEQLWTFDITSGEEIKIQKVKEQQERTQQGRIARRLSARDEVLKLLEKQKTPVSKKWIEEISKASQNDIRSAVTALLADGTLVCAPYHDSVGRTQPSGVILATNLPTVCDEPPKKPTTKKPTKKPTRKPNTNPSKKTTKKTTKKLATRRNKIDAR